jgi:hypothetical protein
MTALILLASLTISAQQSTFPTVVRINFTPGLTYEDGVPLLESEIEHYDLYCNGAFLRQVPNDFTRSFLVGVDDLGPGTHACVLSETVAGIESVASDPLSFSLGQRTPSAPTLTTVAGA